VVTASINPGDNGALRLAGPLTFDTVTALSKSGYPEQTASGDVVVDLSGVTDVDSAGLALLVDWVSRAKHNNESIRFDHVPPRLDQLARIAGVHEWFVQA